MKRTVVSRSALVLLSLLYSPVVSWSGEVVSGPADNAPTMYFPHMGTPDRQILENLTRDGILDIRRMAQRADSETSLSGDEPGLSGTRPASITADMENYARVQKCL